MLYFGGGAVSCWRRGFEQSNSGKQQINCPDDFVPNGLRRGYHAPEGIGLNRGQFLQEYDIAASSYDDGYVQPRPSKSRCCLSERCRNNASQRSDTIMLQYDEERILGASSGIEIFNDVELLGQSKRPHAIGK